MPLLGTRGAASSIGFGQFLSIGGPYWIGVLSGAGNDFGQGIAVDTSGNVYGIGYDSYTTIQLAKYNASGTIQWQSSLGSGNASNGYGIAVDTSGNVYGIGRSYQGGTALQIAKYDTSGTIQWQRSLNSSSPNYSIGYAIAVDTSGNVYVTGNSAPGGSEVLQIAKYDTSGIIQWQRSLTYGSGTSFGYGIAVDTSGNVYIVGYTYNGSALAFQLAKYNTSGVIQWQRSLTSGLGNAAGYGIAVDTSGNVYVTGYSGSSLQLAKYNTSGVIQWQRSLTSGLGNDFGYGITVDTSGNVYVTGYFTFSGYSALLLAKYDTSGTIQWQRRLSTGNVGQGVTVDTRGNVYVIGRTSRAAALDFLFAKLPVDGSKTGTYTVGGTSYTYAASTLTDAASSLTDAASSLTDAATTLTDAATTLTVTSTSLTSSVTTI